MSTVSLLNVEPTRPRAPHAPLRRRVYDAWVELQTWNAAAIARHIHHGGSSVRNTLLDLIADGYIPPRPVAAQKFIARRKPTSQEEVRVNVAAVRARHVRDPRDESCRDVLPPHAVAVPATTQAVCRKYLSEWKRIRAGKPLPRVSEACPSNRKGEEQMGRPHRLHVTRAWHRGSNEL